MHQKMQVEIELKTGLKLPKTEEILKPPESRGGKQWILLQTQEYVVWLGMQLNGIHYLSLAFHLREQISFKAVCLLYFVMQTMGCEYNSKSTSIIIQIIIYFLVCVHSLSLLSKTCYQTLQNYFSFLFSQNTLCTIVNPISLIHF